jgi:toxin ParE1/3/4
MLQLLITPQAELDLEEIFVYTLKTWGISQAEKYQDDLYDQMVHFTSNPDIGSDYYGKVGTYKKIHCNRHLIFYRVEGQNCIVVRVLHERMDLISHI